MKRKRRREEARVVKVVVTGTIIIILRKKSDIIVSPSSDRSVDSERSQANFEASCISARLRVHHVSPTCDITIACRRLSPSVESFGRSRRFLALSPLALLTRRRPRHRPSTGYDAFIFIGDERG